MIRRSISALALGVSLAANSAAQQPSIEFRLAGFDDYMAHLLETWNAPGIGVGIVVKDKLVFAKGYGYRDYGKRIPYTPTTADAPSGAIVIHAALRRSPARGSSRRWNRPNWNSARCAT